MYYFSPRFAYHSFAWRVIQKELKYLSAAERAAFQPYL